MEGYFASEEIGDFWSREGGEGGVGFRGVEVGLAGDGGRRGREFCRALFRGFLV